MVENQKNKPAKIDWTIFAPPKSYQASALQNYQPSEGAPGFKSFADIEHKVLTQKAKEAGSFRIKHK